jgi:hypothetical protein
LHPLQIIFWISGLQWKVFEGEDFLRLLLFKEKWLSQMNEKAIFKVFKCFTQNFLIRLPGRYNGIYKLV